MPNFSGLWTASQQYQAKGASTWPTFPGAPTIGTATVSGTTASVTFTAPSSSGFPATITGYIVTSSPGGLTGTGASSPVTVSGLTVGTAYTFTVRAINASGTGPSSAASNSVTPADYIEDVFSTYLYTGTGSAQTITNNIDLSTNGGLVWIKKRSSTAEPHVLVDSARGATKALRTSGTDAEVNDAGRVSAFTTSGFSIGTDGELNASTKQHVSWTFRKQAKFFDIVTYTGNDALSRQISHSLGSIPGCLIVKCTSNVQDWFVYHRSLAATNSYIVLNSTAAATSGQNWGNSGGVAPTSTVFTVGDNANVAGRTYVAYLFAHNAGGFGLSGTDSVVSCGTYSGTGGTTTPNQVTLGFEPQWVMIKTINQVGKWAIADMYRGAWRESDGSSLYNELNPHTTDYEATNNYGPSPTATGFPVSGVGYPNDSGSTFLYVAIRRGPMKVPTDATKVFAVADSSASFPLTITSDFKGEALLAQRKTTNIGLLASALTQRGMLAYSDSSESSGGSIGSGWSWDKQTGFSIASSWGGSGNLVSYSFARAPSFMDVVAYAGANSYQDLSHNLGVVPELVIIKNRTGASQSWIVGATGILGTGKYLVLNDSAAVASNASFFGSAFTSTIVNVDGNVASINQSGARYVMYLFATCAGVSKVGSYTGNGTTQTINCGFTAGARFVLIKRADSTGDWYVWDTTRGIIAGNDPYLLLNSTAAEVTNTDYIDAAATGFELSSTAPAAINASGGTYIFLAIA